VPILSLALASTPAERNYPFKRKQLAGDSGRGTPGGGTSSSPTVIQIREIRPARRTTTPAGRTPAPSTEGAGATPAPNAGGGDVQLPAVTATPQAEPTEAATVTPSPSPEKSTTYTGSAGG
jgi:hypothetical protein